MNQSKRIGVLLLVVGLITFINLAQSHKVAQVVNGVPLTAQVISSGLDTTPRIAYWQGKVNQHVDAQGNWLTDPDGGSGAQLDKLAYCKKWYSGTTTIRDYKTETITTWRASNNVGLYTFTVMTTQCVQSPKIYVMGGFSGYDPLRTQNDVWSFDGVVWKQLPNAPWSPRRSFGSAVLNNKTYVYGGSGFKNQSSTYSLSTPIAYFNDVWSFDGVVWKQLPNAPWSPSDYMTSAILNNKIYVFGGFDDAGRTKNDIWSFDGTTWTQLQNAPWGTTNWYKSIALNNKIYVFGGNTSMVWSFDGSTWVKLPDMPSSARVQTTVGAASVFNNKIYILGGSGNGNSLSNTVWSFDGTTWTQLQNAPWTPRDLNSSVVLNNILYMFAGQNSGSSPWFTNEVWSFNGTTWTQLQNAPWVPRSEIASVVIPDIDTTAPSIPTGLTATGTVSPQQITLKWTASTDNVAVAGYKIYRNGVQIGTSTSTTYVDSTVDVNTAYAYTVAAYDTTGNISQPSAIVTKGIKSTGPII